MVSSGGLRGLSKVLRNAGFAIAGEIICQLSVVTCLQQLSVSGHGENFSFSQHPLYNWADYLYHAV